MQASAVTEHLDIYWRRGRTLFAERDYPLALFCAMTLIEEVGKVILLGLSELAKSQGGQADEGKLKKALFSHSQKHLTAIMDTLYVNSRVSRIYGDDERKFAEWFREGKLLQLRNDALYLSVSGKQLAAPHQAIAKTDAFLAVCIAGEIYAEAQGHLVGTSPEDWSHIHAEIDTFRREYRD